MLRIPLDTWLIYDRAGTSPDGLRAAALVQAATQQTFQAALVLSNLSAEEVVAVFRILGLPPLPEWEVVSNERARAFFGLDEEG